MIYEHNCYNFNIEYFDNLIEINIKIFLINLYDLKYMKIFWIFLNYINVIC